MSGAKILEGLQQAIDDDLSRVTINGQTWVRLPAGPLVGQLADAHAEIERLRAFPEQCAAMIEGYTAGQIKMAAGEMTAQEMRTVRAVQRWWAAAIRHRFCGGNEQSSGSKED